MGSSQLALTSLGACLVPNVYVNIQASERIAVAEMVERLKGCRRLQVPSWVRKVLEKEMGKSIHILI